MPTSNPSFLGTKQVIAKVGEKEDGVIGLTKHRNSTSKKLVDDVLRKRFHRAPIGRLKMRQRPDRMRLLSTSALSARTGRVERKHDHGKQLHLNNELAADAVSLIDVIKEHLEKSLKSTLRTQKIRLWSLLRTMMMD